MTGEERVCGRTCVGVSVVCVCVRVPVCLAIVCVWGGGQNNLLCSTGPRADLLDCRLLRHTALSPYLRTAERRLGQRCCP